MIGSCPAKVNLRLRVFARDATGYHGVETVLARTDLADEVEIADSGSGITIEVDGPEADGVPAGPDNLCHRAAVAFLNAAFGRGRARPGVAIRLSKWIPAGSGLGGGSSDAAGVLRLLAERWPRLEMRDLLRVAGELGSDVPFALLDVPLALGWERGRRLLPLRPPSPRHALVVCPPFGVSTPDAYRWLADERAAEGRDDPGGASVLPGATRLAEWTSLERIVANDLQPPVVRRHPTLAGVLEILQDAGAVASMTGSGSALFGVFADADRRTDARRRLAEQGLGDDDGWRTHEVRLPI
ncbi:MAG: 4-(cytidine 5'-diphospho)-2-C-methyl-D-erythritol kinase [Gemmatimonadota bacterium]|nr:4-(cytidine 5'-diphospho)-2-C-methyl-D-erythritol kinase [Gemmatimonadota bacterium]